MYNTVMNITWYERYINQNHQSSRNLEAERVKTTSTEKRAQEYFANLIVLYEGPVWK